MADAMSKLFKKSITSSIDIHSGGIDLQFPHHCNEIAQAEAYRSKKHEETKEEKQEKKDSPWSKYFLHSGQLKISGLKMAKSLKNFITIKDALKKYTPRHLRFFFLSHPWNTSIDYSDAAMLNATIKDSYFENFFADNLTNSSTSAFGEGMTKLLDQTRENVSTVLRDNFGYHLAMDLLFSLVNETNKYLASLTTNKSSIKSVVDYNKGNQGNKK
jgi:cysteinyl-tRNA synthetase